MPALRLGGAPVAISLRSLPHSRPQIGSSPGNVPSKSAPCTPLLYSHKLIDRTASYKIQRSSLFSLFACPISCIVDGFGLWGFTFVFLTRRFQWQVGFAIGCESNSNLFSATFVITKGKVKNGVNGGHFGGFLTLESR